VGVVFARGAPPSVRWFRRADGRRRDVRRQEALWVEKRGGDRLIHFALADGDDVAELVWDTASHQWTLDKIHQGD
jgi:hypothetical protein